MIAIIDYGAGNIRSIQRAIETAGEETVVTSDPAVIAAADGVVLPGVGAAGAAMDRLNALGMPPAIEQAVESGKPFLGICLGMQLLFAHQEEGDARGLGLLPGRVRTIAGGEKIPHMGWNRSTPRRDFAGKTTGDGRFFYFVHSFVAEPENPDDVAETADYGETFPSVVARGAVWGTQFHPEKSGEDGLALIRAWVDLVRAEAGASSGDRAE